MGQSEANRERLKAIIAERSVRIGETVTLASGKVSDFYVDMRATTLDGEGATLIAEAILDQITGREIAFIGGLAVGAVPIAAAIGVIAAQRGQTIKPFFVRKQAKDHGRRLQIEGLADSESVAGQQVAVIEDVTTSGGSALEAVDIVRQAGGEIALVLTVVDREEGAAERFAEAGLAFEALFRARDFR